MHVSYYGIFEKTSNVGSQSESEDGNQDSQQPPLHAQVWRCLLTAHTHVVLVPLPQLPDFLDVVKSRHFLFITLNIIIKPQETA